MSNRPFLAAFAGLFLAPATVRCQGSPRLERVPDLALTARLIFDGTNTFRRQKGQPELKTDSKLAKTAEDFAEFMARTDKYSHDADGREPAERATKHDYDYCIITENIAYEYNPAGFTTQELARAFLDGWKKSPEHRKNMLDPDVTEAGMAVAHGEKSGKYYAVSVFGRPKSAAIGFQIVNEAGARIEYHLGDESLTLEPQYTRTHQICRPAELRFTWPEAEGISESFRTGAGERFVITKEAGKLRVTKLSAGRQKAG
jgi:uncharacterized protein YkwD